MLLSFYIGGFSLPLSLLFVFPFFPHPNKAINSGYTFVFSTAAPTTNGSLNHNPSRIQETRHSKVAQTSPVEIVDGEAQSVEVVDQTVVEKPIEVPPPIEVHLTRHSYSNSKK